MFSMLNVQGLLGKKSKKEELLQMSRLENIGVSALQETWLSGENTLLESQMEGFTQVWAVRPTRRGAGASVYTSQDFTMFRNEKFTHI